LEKSFILQSGIPSCIASETLQPVWHQLFSPAQEVQYFGNVKGVKYTSHGDYLVDVSISKEFADQITEHSRFYISLDPKHMERQAVHTVRIKDGGTPVQKNAIVAGTTKYAVLFDQFSVGLRDNLKRFESELNDLIESFRYLSESGQIKRLEKELDRILADLQYLGNRNEAQA
jgi:hypothetical protein